MAAIVSAAHFLMVAVKVIAMTCLTFLTILSGHWETGLLRQRGGGTASQSDVSAASEIPSFGSPRATPASLADSNLYQILKAL